MKDPNTPEKDPTSRSTNEQDPIPEGALEDMSIDFLEDGPYDD